MPRKILLASLCLLACAELAATESWPVPDETEAAEPRMLRMTRYSSGSSRKSNPFMEFLIGCIMWCILPAVIWQNERIAVKQDKLRGKADQNAILVEDVNRTPIPSLNGHVLFMSGESTCQERLADKYFTAVQSTNCVKLRRVVEMYQWVEKVEKEDGRERVSHTMEWKDSEQRCPRGGAQYMNPPMPLPSSQRSLVDYRAHVAAGDGEGEACAEASKAAVRMGAYYLGGFIRREMDKWRPKQVGPEELRSYANPRLTSHGPPRFDGTWHVFGNAGGLQIGDVRIRFEELQCGPLSLCGVLAQDATGYTLVPIIREEGSYTQNCLTEFGCGHCLSKTERVFSSSPADDSELLGLLEDIEPELDANERLKFQQVNRAHTQNFYQADTESGALPKMMHFLGLEEEFLAVIEKQVDMDELIHQEGSHSFAKHCCCRVVLVIAGIIAADLCMSPISFLLTHNWLIGLMGGYAISMVLGCLACFISMTCVLLIMAVSWFRARPRLSATLLILAIVCAMVAVSIFFAEGPELVTTTLAPVAATTPLPAGEAIISADG